MTRDIEDVVVATGPAKPYPGLRPFERHEWSIFCGREVIAREVIGRLAERNLVLVHGGSGCGKSSLVRAGVLPALENEFSFAEGQRFAYEIIWPSEGPLRALAGALAKQLGAPDGEPDAFAWWSNQLLFCDLPAPPGSPDSSGKMEDTAPEAGAKSPIIVSLEERIEAKGLEAFCLVVDQFEEIFPWARDRRPSDVELLVKFLDQVNKIDGERFYAILTMRSDYLGQCAQFPVLSEIINECQYFLPNLDERGIARAIVEPAAMFGGEIDPPLVNELLMDAMTKPDPLPVMQHTLMRMAEPRLEHEHWKLTIDDLITVNGETTALSNHANEIYHRLAPDENSASAATIEWIFRSLLEVDVGGKAIRRPRDFGELVKVSGVSPQEVEAIISAYSADGVNLLTTRKATEGEDKRRVDISHEALLRNWDRMTGTHAQQKPGWIAQEFEDGLTWRMLARYASEPRARLDAVQTEKIAPFYSRITAAPERARRYLLHDGKQETITDEHEWIAVKDLIRRSKRSMLIRRILTAVGVFAAIGLLLSTFSYYQQREYALRELESAQKVQELNLQQQSAKLKILKTEDAVRELTQELAVAKSETDEQALSEDQVVKLESVAQATAGQSSRSGSYMWIGDADLTNLRATNGQPVLPAAVNKGSRYIVTQNVALRSSMPSSPNQSAPGVGVVRRNGKIIALDTPKLWPPSGQYWLQVWPIATTVYLQYANGDRATVDQLMQALRSRNLVVPGAERLSSATGLSEVRYCHEADAGVAAEVAQAVQKIRPGAKLGSRWIGSNGRCQSLTQPGTVELWLGNIR